MDIKYLEEPVKEFCIIQGSCKTGGGERIGLNWSYMFCQSILKYKFSKAAMPAHNGKIRSPRQAPPQRC